MEELVNLLADAYRKNLREHTATGKLENFTTSYSFNGDTFQVFFNLEDYWKYLEEGTKPHFPPINKIKQWINVKRIVPKVYKGKVPTVDQLAYAICKNIAKKGTPPTHALANSITDDLINKICEKLFDKLTEDL